jgi:two-component system, OmpR family, sensor kinase
VTQAPWGSRLSIFGRTFLLMVAALLVAEGIGLVLLVNRPPLHNAPVRLSDIARNLRVSPESSRGGPPQQPNGPSQPPDGPPPQSGGERDGPGNRFGPPPGPPPDGGGPDARRREWVVNEVASEPAAPADADLTASSALQTQLAERLRVDRDRVRVYVLEAPRTGPGPAGADADPELREGFIAALQQNDGRWRVMESIVEGFPTAFQQQAMWLFGIGLAVLFPLSWLFAQALSAPIRRFAVAARRLGNDPNAPPLARDGPPEMQAAVDSFNAMQARLNRLLQERMQMIGAIAHDLRTPLTRLAFRLDDLPHPLNDKVSADIQEMKAMISAAIDFIRDRSLGGQRERLDFRLLVESVVDDQSDIGHNVTLQTGAPVTLEGDPVALRRMVVNLVDNALKYGERARLQLRVTDDRCVLEVDDDGPGIPDALQERVFEPFFRAESSRNRNTGGIGLGLAAVRAIVLDHGGQISLRNRKEGGLRAAVSLPMTG